MRVAIVNDVALAREVLRRIILSTPEHSVAWVAENGEMAVKFALQDPPDIILMDLVMPVMDGVEATRRIMMERPCPILLVTSSVSGNFNMVYRAMGHGGMDAVNTPTLGPAGEVCDSEGILARLAKISRSKSPTLAISAGQEVSQTQTRPLATNRNAPVIAIGASTGGPAALVKILSKLPPNLPASVIIVQHIGADFAPSLASWLQDQCALPVRVAKTGDIPKVGEVLLAGTNDHLIVQGDGRLSHTAEPVSYPYRPSVDLLFSSLAKNEAEPGIAVLLTGMGNDGAQGLWQLRMRGWHTIAQDQASSVVYGMPKAAAERHAACEILPLELIPAALLRQLKI
jgi:two-component system, chemotaxis family, response regulator WspF